MNKKRFIIIIIILIIITVSIFSAFLIFRTDYKTIKMNENQDLLINPERGVYTQIDTSQAYKIEDYYNGEENTRFRLVLMVFDLNEYVNFEVIPEKKIQELINALDIARECGMSAIFRPGYYFSSDDEILEPESFSTILKHEKQIAEVINQYTDVISCVQGGFIGPYGEWHSSNFMDEETKGMKNYILLLKNMLEDIDSSIAINIRRPMFIREAIEAGIDCSRVGYYDDGMFGSEKDLGTYEEEGYSRAKELEWLSLNIKTPFNGGELPFVTEYSNADNAIKELELMQVTYLNQNYNADVWEDWDNSTYNGENAKDYIINHLGYRLSISQISVPKKPDNVLGSTITGYILNTGFAKASEEYRFYLVVQTKDNVLYIPIDYKYNSKSEMEFSADLSRDIFLGKHDEGELIKLGLMITSSKEKDERYCVEFANDKVVYENGINYFITYIYSDQKWDID